MPAAAKPTYEEIIAELESRADPRAVAGMARFGIATGRAYGVPVPVLRELAKRVGRDHALAERLWAAGYRETRIVASIVADPRATDEAMADRWARDFDSWEIVDQCVMNLLERTPFAYRKALAWSEAEPEFVKRAGFVLMARLAVCDKKAGDAPFVEFLRVVVREAADGRNNVKKAVNWALRQIGKRNAALNEAAVAAARELQQSGSAARWVAGDALRELTSGAVRERLARVSGGGASSQA